MLSKLKYWLLGLLTTGILVWAGYALALVSLPPSVQRGDLLYATSTTQIIRLPTSTVGSVLWLTNNLPAWTATSTLGISGSLSGGTNGFLARWTSGSALSTSVIRDNGTVAGVNATSSTVSFNIQGSGVLNPFNISSSTGTSLLHVTHSGSVGINTTTPIGKLSIVNPEVDGIVSLHIMDTTNDNYFRVYSNGTSEFDIHSDTGISINPETYVSITPVAGVLTLSAGVSSGAGQDVNLSAGNSTSGNNPGGDFYILPGDGNGTGRPGSVGINTNTPTATFSVSGKAGNWNPFIVASSTHTPLFKVDVYGSTTIANLTAASCDVKSTTGGSLYCGTDATGAGGSGNSAWTIGSGLIHNATSTDEVGIGTSTPGYTLTLQGNGSTGLFRVASSTGRVLLQANANGTVDVGSDTGNLPVIQTRTNGQTYFRSLATPGTPDITAFIDTDTGFSWDGSNGFIFSAGGAEAARLDVNEFLMAANKNIIMPAGTGKIGINTTSPITTFHLQGNGGTIPFRISTSTGASLFQIDTFGSTTIANLTAASCDVKSTTGGSLYCGIDTTGASTGNAAWTILNGVIHNATSTDEIGIGTSTPAETLHIQGNGAINPFRISSSTGTTLFGINTFGSTTIANLGAGLVRSISGGSLFNGLASLTADVSGILPIANGGTATSSVPISNALYVGDGSNFYQSVLPSCSNTTTSKLLYNSSTRTFSCGTDQTGGGGGSTTTITSNLQVDGPNFTFATGSVTGLNLNITGDNGTQTVTFSPQLQTGYVIPLTASTTEWSGFYNTPSTRITAGNNLSWSGNTLNGTMASSTIIAGGTATHSPSITFATSTDTNILLNIVCAISTCTYNPSWTGVLSLARGGIATTTLGNLTVGTGLSVTGGQQVLIGTSTQISLGTNVVTSVVNDTNVTGSISSNALTLGWTGVLAVARGGIATTTLGNLTVSSSNLSVTGGERVLIGTSTVITLTNTPTFTTATVTGITSLATTSLVGTLTVSSLTSGNCVQAGAGGLLTTVGAACGSGGSGNTAFLFGPSLIYNATSTDSVLIGTSTPTTAKLFVQGSGTQLPLVIATSTGNTLFQIGLTGNVGIGTTTAGSALTVVGGAQITGLSSCTNGITTDANGIFTCRAKRAFIPVLGSSFLPDSSGNVYAEPFSISSSTVAANYMLTVFRDSGTKVCGSGMFMVPRDYNATNATITPVWTANVATGNMSWEIAYRTYAGSNTDVLGQATFEQTASTTAAAPSGVFRKINTEIGVTAANFAASDLVGYRICRDGTQSADTMAATTTLHSLLFEYDK